MNKAPKFWNDQTILSSALSTALLPLSWIWRGVTAARLAWIKPEKAQLPVICIGNISVGGTGKTPFTAYLCQLLGSYGYSVCILTRGYGGKQKGPNTSIASGHVSEYGFHFQKEFLFRGAHKRLLRLGGGENRTAWLKIWDF